MRLELSTRPEERIGDDAMWDRAEDALTTALEQQGLQYELNPGDGAFYGPKIDMHMTDSLGRSWQLGTVQLDYSMPARFGLTYTGADNAEHTPGDDPPRLLRLLRALHRDHARALRAASYRCGSRPCRRSSCRSQTTTTTTARSVAEDLRALEAHVELDDRGESVGRKIRDAELRKIPYMLIVGEREQADLQRLRARAPQRRHRGRDRLRAFTRRLRGELYSAPLRPRPSSERDA